MRELIPTAVATRDGATITEITGDPVNHHSINNNPARTGVRVNNTDAAPQTITFQTPYQKDGLDLEERVETVPAGAVMIFGPFDKATYGQDDPDNAITGNNAVLFQVSHAGMLLSSVRIT